MKTSEQTQEIFSALSKFREVVKQPSKDADNPFFKSKYVPLESVIDVIDSAIPGTGLSYMQEVSSEEKKASVTTHIFHSSGQYITLDPLTIPAAKPDAQGLGSAITYAKRYSLAAAFGLANDLDDDGNSACEDDGSNQKNNTEKKDNKKLSNAQLETAKNKLAEFSRIQQIGFSTAIEKIFSYLNIKCKSVENLSGEDFGILMNYLNSKMQKINDEKIVVENDFEWGK